MGTDRVTLAAYHDRLDDETADDLDRIVGSRRDASAGSHRERVRALADELDDHSY